MVNIHRSISAVEIITNKDFLKDIVLLLVQNSNASKSNSNTNILKFPVQNLFKHINIMLSPDNILKIGLYFFLKFDMFIETPQIIFYIG